MSGAAPPPAARPLEWAARVPRPGVPGAVGAGVGTQHRPHSVRPCGPALLAVGKGKGKVLGRSPNSSVSVIPTCPKAQHATSYYAHQNSCNSGTVNSRDT